MKFDYCIGNPPYQDGNVQIYTSFYKEAQLITTNALSLIFPSGWQEPKNANGLAKMNNEEVKRDKQIVEIRNIQGAFPGVSGAEHTNIITWKPNYDNKLNGLQKVIEEDGTENIKLLPISIEDIEKPKIIKSIVEKVNKLNEPKIYDYVSTRQQYGLGSDALNEPQKYNLELFDKEFNGSARLFGRMKTIGRTFKYIDKNKLINKKSTSLLNSYKLFVVKAWGNMGESTGFLGGSYSPCICAKPLDCCTEMYIEVGPFNNENEVNNCRKYFYTKFFRAVFYNKKMSQNTARDTYIEVPIQNFTNNSDIDWSKSIEDIDKQLYKKYGLTQEEINFVEEHIKPIEDNDLDIEEA